MRHTHIRHTHTHIASFVIADGKDGEKKSQVNISIIAFYFYSEKSSFSLSSIYSMSMCLYVCSALWGEGWGGGGVFSAGVMMSRDDAAAAIWTR